MDTTDLRRKPAEDLHRRARAIVDHKVAQLHAPLAVLSPEATQQMVHELWIHQIELEMQNEELRRTQQALDAARARYFTLYDLAPVGYCTLSEHGLIREANFCAATLLGMTRDALVSQPILNFIQSEDRDIFHIHCRKLMGCGEAQVCELRILRPAGTPLWVRLESTTAREADGAGVLRVVLSDISERKRGEAVLQASEERYRCLAEDMPIFVATLAADGTLTYVNEALTALVSLTRSEMVGRNVQAFLSADDQVLVRKRLVALTPEQPIETHEQRYVTSHGEVAIHQWTIRAFFDVTGKVVRYQAIGRDITERQRIESELIAAKQVAENANLAKSRFLAAASHDLRQPIQAISLFNDALFRTGLNAEQRVISDYLSLSVHSLGELLGALLDISKLDAGVVELCPEAVEVDPFFSRLATELSPMASVKGLRFMLFCPRQDVAIRADRKLLMSLLGNLVGNAIKYTEQGGVLVGIRRRGRQAVIQIWDTGIGVASEHRERIFDEYFQIQNPERDRTKGLGLGLAIVKRLAALMGTEVLCRSRPGRGSVFEFCLPLAGHFQEAGTYPAASVCAEAGRVARQVVVVEDDVMVARAIAVSLESVGMVVSTYLSAEQALADPEIFEAQVYITDFQLSGENGAQFLSTLRQRSAKPFKAVILTGDASAERIEAIRSSPWPVLFKPIELVKLLAAISD